MRTTLLVIIAVLSSLVSRGTERFVLTSDGVKLFVEIRGKGNSCLYIHGGPGAGSRWMMDFYGDFLEEHFTMIYLDQRGVGRSSTPANLDYSIERMTLDFEEVRRALNIPQWTTLAHSFGGILQVDYAKKYPAVHQNLIMVNCTLNMKESFSKSWIPYASSLLKQEAPSQYENNAAILDTLFIKITELRSRDLLWKMTFANKANDEKLRNTYSVINNWNNSFASNAFQIEDYWKDYKAITPEIQIPVLFFYGQNDMSIGPQHFIGVNFPNMTLKSANCGHMPFLEALPELGEAMLEFIK